MAFRSRTRRKKALRCGVVVVFFENEKDKKNVVSPKKLTLKIFALGRQDDVDQKQKDEKGNWLIN